MAAANPTDMRKCLGLPLHKVVFVVVFFSFNLFCFALAHHS